MTTYIDNDLIENYYIKNQDYIDNDSIKNYDYIESWLAVKLRINLELCLYVLRMI